VIRFLLASRDRVAAKGKQADYGLSLHLRRWLQDGGMPLTLTFARSSYILSIFSGIYEPTPEKRDG